MKLSARNQFKGTVVDIQDGAVNGIVKIDIGGGQSHNNLQPYVTVYMWRRTA